jgi:hypothetical protein
MCPGGIYGSWLRKGVFRGLAWVEAVHLPALRTVGAYLAGTLPWG